LIRVRIARARKIGLRQVITYTSNVNFRSAANLIRAGMQFYKPENPWALPGAFYFNLHLD
jgi:hypothetical protein